MSSRPPSDYIGRLYLERGRGEEVGGHFRYAKEAKSEGKYCSLFIVLFSCLFEFKNSLQIFLNVKNRNKLFKCISCQRVYYLAGLLLLLLWGERVDKKK